MTSDASGHRESTLHPLHPLRRLWRRQGQYRLRVVAAFAATSIGKIADVMPELLIGAAVVVVRGSDSLDELVAAGGVYAGLWAVPTGMAHELAEEVGRLK